MLKVEQKNAILQLVVIYVP